MQSRPRVPGEPEGQNHSQAPVASAGNRDVELAAIALLCLMFPSPVDEPREPQVGLVWR
jgi:hypothetical protein